MCVTFTFKNSTNNHFSDAFVYAFNNLKLNKMKYENTEEQIKIIEADGCTYVKEWFPEVFKEKPFTGWKRSSHNNYMVYFENNLLKHGFQRYDVFFVTERTICLNECGADRDATDSEVLEALTNEFKKQNPNIVFKEYKMFNNVLYGYKYVCVREELFKDGVFTKFHTKEEAEKMLNAKIV